MIIALDWDGTYTADPALWEQFSRIAKSRGHEVTIVTGRTPQEPITVDLPVIYCSHTPKSEHFHADVVIDDIPDAWSKAGI